MKRLEIIANQSVREDLIESLETQIPGFQYSLLPTVHGRGPEDWKLGTTVWPEENFVLFAYVDDEVAAVAKTLVANLKARYPREGVKVYSLTVD